MVRSASPEAYDVLWRTDGKSNKIWGAVGKERVHLVVVAIGMHLIQLRRTS